MPYILKKYYPARNILFALGEGMLIFMALNLIFFLVTRDNYAENITLFTYRAILVTLIFQICLYYFDLYDLRLPATFTDTASRVTQAFGVGCIVLAILYYIAPIIIINTTLFWLQYVAICVVIAIWRCFYTVVLERRMFTRNIIILGTGDLARKITAEINSRLDSGHNIVAQVAIEANPDPPNGIPLISAAELEQTCRDKRVEKIVTAMDDRRGKTPIKELLSCKLRGIPIEEGVPFYEGLAGKIMVEKVDPTWIIFSEGFKKGRFTLLLKRILDLGLAGLGLILSLPLTTLTAVFIKLDSPGPILYSQDRVGLHGQTFKIIKFRSMRTDAEKFGPQWAATDDDRVTRVGNFIRMVRIDEIPQLWNILRGEMSLVGPRPERPNFVEQLEQNIPFYSLRHNVKPGVTGWAQIFYPYGATEEDALRKLEFDLYYIKNMSLRMDLWIIFQTIKIVLFQKGAR